MDAITLLKADHKNVAKLFRDFEKARKHEDPERKQLVQQMIEELSIHTAIEEEVFYPTIRREIEGIDDDVLEAFEEHHVAKWLLEELTNLPADDERYDAKVTVLIENVRHHVKEEEDELFPEVRDALSRKRLGEIGEQLESAKADAPRQPQPDRVVRS
jgi:hemerythrin-like domain-containing protein